MRPLLVGFGVVAMALAAWFGFNSISDPAVDRSSEEAAEAFLTALSNQDTIGAAETLVPTERDVLIEFGPQVLDELQRLEVFGDVNLSNVQGTDLTTDIDQLTFTSETLSPDTHRVVVTGPGLTFSGNGADVPTGSAFEGIAGATTDSDIIGDVFTGGLELMALRVDNRFSISLTHTFAEVLRNFNRWPEPSFDNTIEPLGGDSPEDAVRRALRGVEAGDLEAIISMADPIAGAVFYDYAPAWWTHSPQVKDFSEQAGWTINEMSFVATGTGGRRTVAFASFDYDGRSAIFPRALDAFNRPIPDVRRTFDGECFYFDGDPGFSPTNGEGPVEARRREVMEAGICLDALEEVGHRPGAMSLTSFLTPSAAADSVEVVEREGRWFIHPTASILTHWLDYAVNLAPLPDADDQQFGFPSTQSFRLINSLATMPLTNVLPDADAVSYADFIGFSSDIDPDGG